MRITQKKLHEYLQEHDMINTDPGGFWPMHYLPHVESLMNKVSYHASGFPWMTEEDQKPFNYGDYNKSHRIMRRSLNIDVSWYFSKQMMVWYAKKVNDGLDLLYGSCSQGGSDMSSCSARF